MVSIYYLSGFNNYYNRTILLPQSNLLSAYSDYLLKVDEIENFNPNNNVMTQLVVNYWGDAEDISDLLNIDYVLISSDNRTIDSKWFALDRQRVRGQQWQFTLRRDLVSDNYNDVINAPCFIEKATLSADNPLLFNSENMTFNQIKQDEILLKDETQCPWIVGYLSNKREGATTGQIARSYVKPDIVVNSFDEWEYSEIAALGHSYSQGWASLDIYQANVITYGEDANVPTGMIFMTQEDGTTSYAKINEANTNVYRRNTENYGAIATSLREAYIRNGVAAQIRQSAPNYMGPIFPNTSNQYSGAAISQLDGKLISIGGALYRITVSTIQKQTTISGISSGSLFNTLANWVADTNQFTGTANQNCFNVRLTYTQYNITLNTSQSGVENLTATIPANAYELTDAPYTMFCMPYADMPIYNLASDADPAFIQSKEISMMAAIALAKDNSELVWDIQLLPFNPASYIWDSESKKIAKNSETVGTITIDGSVVGNIFFPVKSNFTFDIPYQIDVPIDAQEKKIMNECEMWRLCSPNYNGIFEFNPAKNDGVLYFNVDCTYIPFNPYIHINPNFGGLYGRDFDDSRGLICGGDFSLPIVTDKWETYQLNNKNYQQIFDRQIENMEINNSVQRTMDFIGTLTGSLTSGASGAAGGAAVGGLVGSSAGPIGAAIGGAAGILAGTFGGAADIYFNEKLRNEALDYTKDQFGYQLGNIQALPHSLARTTAYTNNNKIFPFLEKYSATDTEKEALRKKMKYDGMTVMAIGTIAEYQKPDPSYIKGRLIRIENSQTLDYYSLAELANEINKGVFI